MKRLIKWIFAVALYSTGTVRFAAKLRGMRARSKGCRILMYHRVLPKTRSAQPDDWRTIRSQPGIVVSEEIFARQLEFLSENYTVISLREFLNGSARDSSYPKNSVVITFDDGWRDNYAFAFPLLKKFGLPATIFLTTGFVGTETIFWPERIIHLIDSKAVTPKAIATLHDIPEISAVATKLNRVLEANQFDKLEPIEDLIAAIKPLNPKVRDRMLDLLALSGGHTETSSDRRVVLNWQEVREMRASGIDFGGHGVSHEILTEISEDEAEREISECRQDLELELKPDSYAFAYPNGNFNEMIAKRVKESRFHCAVSTRPGVADSSSDLFALPRFNIHDGCCLGPMGNFSKAIFACHIEGVFA